MSDGKIVTVIGENVDMLNPINRKKKEYMALHPYFRDHMRQLTQEGYDHFIVPINSLDDLIIAKKIKNLELRCVEMEFVFPSREFCESSPTIEKEIGRKYLSWRDKITFITERQEDSSYIKEMRYFLDKSDCLFAITNAQKSSRITYTARYAASRGKKIIRFYTDPEKIRLNSVLKNFAHVVETQPPKNTGEDLLGSQK